MIRWICSSIQTKSDAYLHYECTSGWRLVWWYTPTFHGQSTKDKNLRFHPSKFGLHRLMFKSWYSKKWDWCKDAKDYNKKPWHVFQRFKVSFEVEGSWRIFDKQSIVAFCDGFGICNDFTSCYWHCKTSCSWNELEIVSFELNYFKYIFR